MCRCDTPFCIVSVLVLLVGASCRRGPQEDPSLPSEASQGTRVDSKQGVEPGEFSATAPGSSTPDTVSVAVQADKEPKSVSRLDAAHNIGVREIDLNSGDLRETTLDMPPRREIRESELSREVRRLGIPIPEERQWRVFYRLSTGGMAIKQAYSDLLPAACMLLDSFDEIKAVDEERRAVLERLMTSLQTENPLRAIEEAHVLIVEVTDRYGVKSPFRADYAEHLRQLRTKLSEQ